MGDKTTLADGYARLTNPLIEAAAKTHFTPSESKCFWCIVRYTYGFSRPRARISRKLWEDTTGLHATHAYRAVKSLINRNIVTRNGHSYKINPRIQSWKKDLVTNPRHSPILVTNSDQDSSLISDQSSSLYQYRKKKTSKERGKPPAEGRPVGASWKTCPYCGYTANHVTVDHNLKGCNACKPKEID